MRLDRWITLGVVRPALAVGSRLRGLEAGGRGNAVPILMYHSIADDPETGRSGYYKTGTSPARFREHMQILAEEGFESASLTSILDQSGEGPENVRSPKVVITFDDGFTDFRSQAWPVLKEFAFTATVFLATNFVGEDRRRFLGKTCLTWSEIRELDLEGLTFGSHTLSHPVLLALDQTEFEWELTRSKEVIESNLGKRIDTFAYPFAFPAAHKDHVRRFRETALRAGYRACVTTTIGRYHPGDDRVTMKRLPINEDDDATLFRAKLQGAYDWMATPQALKKRIGRVVGGNPAGRGGDSRRD